MCVAKWEISNISLIVRHIGYQSHGILQNFTNFPPISAISSTCQNGHVIKQHNHIGYNYNWGIYGCKIHCIYAKCLVNNILKIWYWPYYTHTSCSMLVQYPIVSILCVYTNIHSVYTVCLVEAYSTQKCTKFT